MQRCGYKFYKGKHKGTQCETRSKSAYCHRHRNCIEATGVDKSDGVKNDPVFANTNKPASVEGNPTTEKLHSSVFAITINSNIPHKNMTEDQKGKFKKFIDY